MEINERDKNKRNRTYGRCTRGPVDGADLTGVSIRVLVSLDQTEGLRHITSNRVVVLAEVADNSLGINDEGSTIMIIILINEYFPERKKFSFLQNIKIRMIIIMKID